MHLFPYYTDELIFIFKLWSINGDDESLDETDVATDLFFNIVAYIRV